MLLASALLMTLTTSASPDLASGALSYFVSKRCDDARKPEEPFVLEWPALTYGRGRPPMWGTKKVTRCRPENTWMYTESLAAGALWSIGDQQALTADWQAGMFDPEKTYPAFQKVFGWEAPNHGVLNPNDFNTYRVKDLKRLFAKAYLKPTERIGPITAQQLYDLVFKENVAQFARDAAYLKKAVSKAKAAQLLKAYKAEAKKKGSQFEGRAYLKQLAATLVPETAEPATARNGKTLGILLRRTGDGTWPTVLTTLKKVLADYDPELAKELKKAL